MRTGTGFRRQWSEGVSKTACKPLMQRARYMASFPAQRIEIERFIGTFRLRHQANRGGQRLCPIPVRPANLLLASVKLRFLLASPGF